MKAMIISDIHGNIDNLNRVLDIFKIEKCEKLYILGDLFNYGIDYYKMDILEKLNSMAGVICAVRGNCDTDVDISNILFGMPYIREEYLNNKRIVLTHGNLYDKQELCNYEADIVLTGHSHIAKIEKFNDKLFINPGSISKSRVGDNSFAILDNNKVFIKNLNNDIIEEYNI